MNSAIRLLFCLALGLSYAPALLAQPQPAAGDVPQEFQVKAAYIYNFLSFTEWSNTPETVLDFCLYGPDPFGTVLDAALADKSIGGRSLNMRRVNTVEQLADCHIVFISSDVSSNLSRVLDALGERNVLTIADSEGATADGVIFNMTTEADHISFAVNLRAAHQRGLTISYRLLRLAAEVVN
ncbi:MAG: YfiR family protein [Pseudomonadota bacterium]